MCDNEFFLFPKSVSNSQCKTDRMLQLLEIWMLIPIAYFATISLWVGEIVSCLSFVSGISESWSLRWIKPRCIVLFSRQLTVSDSPGVYEPGRGIPGEAQGTCITYNGERSGRAEQALGEGLLQKHYGWSTFSFCYGTRDVTGLFCISQTLPHCQFYLSLNCGVITYIWNLLSPEKWKWEHFSQENLEK